VFQPTDRIHENVDLRPSGLNANAAWSSRRVNGRTSEESLDVGDCPAAAMCSSRVLYVFYGKIDNAGSMEGLLARALEQVA
jgi:hypothetical protein